MNVRGYIVAYETYEQVGDILKIDGTGSASLNGLGAGTVTYHFDLNLITGAASGSHQFTWPMETVFHSQCRARYPDRPRPCD